MKMNLICSMMKMFDEDDEDDLLKMMMMIDEDDEDDLLKMMMMILGVGRDIGS